MTEQMMRPDRGPRYSERERSGIRWIAEEGGAQFEQVQRVLARLSPNPEKLTNPAMLSVQRTRKKKDRWKNDGLIEYKLFEAVGKGWLWPTRKGLEFVGLGELRYYEPKLESLRHLYYVNQAALQAGQKASHIPDALLLKPNGEIIAIEVELTLKKRERILATLKELVKMYYRTWYFVAQPAWTTVEAALEDLPDKQRKSIQMLSVEQKLH